MTAYDASAKANMAIINVHQFFPEITTRLEVVKNKYSYLADNSVVPTSRKVTQSTDKPESSESQRVIKESGKLPGTTEESSGAVEPQQIEAAPAQTNVFPTSPEEVAKPEQVSNPASAESGQPPPGTEAKLGGDFIVGTWHSSTHATLPGLQDVLNTRCAEHYQAGKLAQKNCQWEESLNHFTKCIQLKPQEPVYYVQRGEVFLLIGDFASAILNYKRACLLDAANVEYNEHLAFLYVFYGQTLFDQKLYPEALEAFSRACELKPHNPQYQNRSIACLAAFHRHTDCLNLVNQKLQQEPENSDLLVLRARLHYLFRNFKLCYFDLQDALQLDPNHGAGRVLWQDLQTQAEQCKTRSVELGLLGRDQEALNKISLAIEMNPAVADYHVKRGGFQRKLGDFGAAIDDYLVAMDKVEHEENHPVYKAAQRQILMTFNDLAMECYRQGRYEDGIGLLNRAIQVEKREVGLYLNRGDCFFKAGSLTFALEDYQQALEMEPQSNKVHSRVAQVHHTLSLAAFHEHSYDEAVTQVMEALRHDPTVHQYWSLLARANYVKQNLDDARLMCIISISLQPHQEDLASLIARLFPGKTNTEVMLSPLAEKARAEFQKVYETRYPPTSNAVEHAEPPPAEVITVQQSSSTPPPQAINDRRLFMDMIEEKKILRETMKRLFHERRFHKPKVHLADVKDPQADKSVAERHNWTSMKKGAITSK